MNLLNDVNLDEIVVGKDGRSLKLSFIDMYEGNNIGMLQCYSVYLFDYQNIFEEDDSLAAYVGEINYEIIEVSEYLKRSGYVFSCNGFLNRKLLVIAIEGGEIALKIVCGSANFNNKELE